MLSAKPKTGTAAAHDQSGAFVSCWINFPLADGAELLARHYVEEAGWEVESVEEVRETGREFYDGQPELQYMIEAEERGASFVWHLYPEEAENAERPY